MNKEQLLVKEALEKQKELNDLLSKIDIRKLYNEYIKTQGYNPVDDSETCSIFGVDKSDDMCSVFEGVRLKRGNDSYWEDYVPYAYIFDKKNYVAKMKKRIADDEKKQNDREYEEYLKLKQKFDGK